MWSGASELPKSLVQMETQHMCSRRWGELQGRAKIENCVRAAGFEVNARRRVRWA